ncbi:hypothetical protein LINPERHAP2_LOCUS14190 [Linum perenne]
MWRFLLGFRLRDSLFL